MFGWGALNKYHNLSALKKKILDAEQNNGGPHDAQITPEPPEWRLWEPFGLVGIGR